MLHDFGASDWTPIALVTYMWRPSSQLDRDHDASAVYDDGACNGLEFPKRFSTSRRLWVWIHISAFTAGYDALKLACHIVKDHAWGLKRHSVAEVPDVSEPKTVLEIEEGIPSHAVLSLRDKDPHMFIEK